MGLTGEGRGDTLTVALCGNPNVGKSTLFNALTGMRQHTGNWTGKTVSLAWGTAETDDAAVTLVDLPGCYSLEHLSPEEKVSRDFLMAGEADAVIIVCDALSLERNLILAIQMIELCPRAVLCVNLMDEAKRRGAVVDLALLSRELGIGVFPTDARSGEGIESLLSAAVAAARSGKSDTPFAAPYGDELVSAAREIKDKCQISSFEALLALGEKEGVPKDSTPPQSLEIKGFSPSDAAEAIRSARVERSGQIASAAIVEKPRKSRAAHIADRILTGKYTAAPAMCVILFIIFWITAKGANVPSELLAALSLKVELLLRNALTALSLPPMFVSALVDGVYRVSSWVVCVMLPPMAIFFPIFTLLEDVGVFPRIAFNLDRAFRACGSCGKHALTFAMGMGCNAVGVVGCRIIEGKRERLLAVLTNAFIPCNGRIGGMLLLISTFLAATPAAQSAWFFGFFVLAVAAAMGTSLLLSRTALRGEATPFAMEMVSYRRPQILKTIVRSVKDRTVAVLGRAVAVAAPAGLVIWLLANVEIGGVSLLTHFACLLDPLGRFFGMDGVILSAFILGIPANEIVLPLCAMMYTSASAPEQGVSVANALIAGGWTGATAVTALIFILMHWPCSTTLLTVRREYGTKTALLAFAVPTVAGLVLCLAARAVMFFI